MPFYVAPEQLMRDRADFARKNIARGRPLVAMVYADGVLIVAENSTTLHKVSEIYDHIAFGGVGKYSEFDTLRKAGVREADLRGYAYSREDVTAQSLANVYAGYLTQVFTHDVKPMEVEILVAEIGGGPTGGQLYHISYDGIVFDDNRYVVLGGDADAVTNRMEGVYLAEWPLGEALRAAVQALAGPERTLTPGELEVAVLDSQAERRAFRRIEGDELTSLLG